MVADNGLDVLFAYDKGGTYEFVICADVESAMHILSVAVTVITVGSGSFGVSDQVALPLTYTVTVGRVQVRLDEPVAPAVLVVLPAS